MPAIGDNFLRYKIISLIGSGGMGEVYVAKDRQLERKVAIKILRQKYHKNEDSLQRFIMEARSASALNHPNIITIYDIGEAEGSHYIASEFVDGRTLHQRIDNGRLSVNEILNIAVQIAEALTAAHAAGIVHRDVKPENVMVRSDGYVKVLDFGLAKLTEHAAQLADGDADTRRLVTNPGIVMGTVSYMSPEQARGRRVDGRSDIWSLGVVMYEMVTAKRPFPGDTTSDVIAAILKSEPPSVTVLVPDTPKELERIINKALRKDRDDRYQHIKDLLIDLKDLKHDLDLRTRGDSAGIVSRNGNKVGESTSGASPVHTTLPVLSGTASISEMFLAQFKLHPILVSGIILLAIAGLGTLGLGIKKIIDRPSPSAAFQSMRLARLTTSGTAVGGEAAISSDGHYLAYAAQDAGQQSLWVQQVATHGSVQIVPPGNFSYKGLAFTPDSNYVFYVAETANETPSVYRIPAVGGENRKIISNASGPITFAPKGDRFAFVRDEKTIIVTDPDGKNVQTLATAGEGEVWMFPAWSPDGSRIACAAYTQRDSNFRITVVNVSDGKETSFHSLTWYWISGLSWLPDGSGLIASARDQDTELSQLWLTTYPDGEVSRLTNDLNSFQGFSLTGDGKSAVSVQEIRTANIWVADDGNLATLHKITTDVGKDEGLSGISWAPNGRIIFTTRTKGRQDLRVVDRDGGNGVQLTSDSKSNFWPVVSPDDRYIVFISSRNGNVDLWRMNADGTEPVQLTSDPELESQPTISPDSRWIVYQRTDANNKTTIWKMSIDGGQATQLVDSESRAPVFSPDGKSLLFKYSPDGGANVTKLGLTAMNADTPIQQLDLPAILSSRWFRWSPDGKGIVYMGGQNADRRLWIQAIKGGEPKEFMDTKDLRIFGFDLSRDGHGIALALGEETSDVVLVNNFR
jgi:serine/threonine protein kinase/Tol biopolymer transport system component